MNKQESRPHISKVWRALSRQERWRAGLVFLLITGGVFLETLGIGLVVPMVVVLTQEDVAASYPQLAPVFATLGNPSQEQLIIGGMLALLTVYILKNFYLAALAWVKARFVASIRIRLSQKLFSIYLTQPWPFHLQRNSTKLVRNALQETQNFAQSGVKAMLQLAGEVALLLAVLGLVLVVAPIEVIWVFVVLGLASFMFYRITRNRLTRWGAERQHHDALKLQHIQQGLHGAKDVKLLGREYDFLERFAVHNARSARLLERQGVINELPRLWLELLAVGSLVSIVLILVGQQQSLAGIFPTLALLAAAAFRLLPSASRILGALNQWRFALPVIDNIYSELQLKADASGQIRPRASQALQRAIVLDDVGYHYPGAATASLQGISLIVNRGEAVGLVGASGAGKSTLVDVLLGLLPANPGRVTVDGVDIQDKLRGWQDQIGYVPQSIYLTDDSLRRNIAFGIPDIEIDGESLNRAIRAAQLDAFTASLPDGVNTVVGERGVRLSGGQRQRIGIARALYHDPSVLVLDEATSALDTQTEQEVMEAVSALQGAKTLIIVAHRLSTVAGCDRLYCLDAGKVVDEGAPSTLLPRLVASADLEVRRSGAAAADPPARVLRAN